MTGFDAPLRAHLERTILAPYLARQRWFGGKARRIAGTRFADWAVVATEPCPIYVSLVEVSYDEGGVERYQLPLIILGGRDAERVRREHPEAVLTDLPGDESAALCDAVTSPDAARALLSAVWSGATFTATHGAIVASPVAASPRDAAEPPLEVVRLPGVHSNSAITLGGRYLLKLFRRIEPGINPDVEIGKFFVRSGAQVQVPPLIGSIEYCPHDSGPATLALVQALVPSRANGWEHALDELRQFFARARRAAPPTAASPETIGSYLQAIATLGRRTAEMHAALAGGTGDPDFAPEPAAAALPPLLAHMQRQAVRILDLLTQRYELLDGESRSAAGRVLEHRTALLDRLQQLGQRLAPFVRIRIHGDYHLGQVLRVAEDFVIIDFEGEPTKPLAERRTKQSPLRDVAGMLRSLSYAAHTGLRVAAGPDRQAYDALAPLASAWEAATSKAFLEAYCREAGGSVFMPADPAQLQLLLETFVLDKALYELDYELNNRPEWIAIPLAGVLNIVDRRRAGDL